MLITVMKPKSEILPPIEGKTVLICCEGCREVYFPDADVAEAVGDLRNRADITAVITTDYICNPDNLLLQTDRFALETGTARTLAVFACGVGVQTVTANFPGKNVLAACDTYPLPGYQGLTPLECDCDGCGECCLGDTGGICPITACSKSLLNGQCGGASAGMCEADKDMECGWERIYRRLRQLKPHGVSHEPVKVRNYDAGKD